MDSQPPSSSTTVQNGTEPSQPPQPQSSPSLPPISSSLHSSPNPNPIRNPNPLQSQAQASASASASRPPAPAPRPPPPSFNRTLPPPQQQQPSHHQQSHFHHFSSAPSTASSIPGGAAPRGGMAIGVPTHHQSPSPPFSSSFGQHQHFGSLNRTGVNVTESPSSSNTSQVKAPMQGMGILGSSGSSSQMRPGGMPAHQQRPVQSSIRPPLPAQNNQSTPSQSFQGHGLVRNSSVGSPVSPSPSASQSMQSLNQPWLSSGPQGKPPLPSPSYRQQLNPQSMQQRSHVISQQQQPMPTASQQKQQQPLPSNQSQEHFGQQVPSSRAAIHVPHQQQVTRIQGSGNQKPSSLLAAQSSAVQTGIHSKLPNADTDESSNSILSKRSIHELVHQVDPAEKLDPEVADVLVDIAESFFESITRSGCSLAKHRKSTTLEAKDILLHLEKNWNMTLPGFGGDEIKGYRRQPVSDIHKERLAAIKKSIVATEAVNAKGSAGQASGSAKGSQAKTPLNVIGSPNFKSS
ncbi:hypothetical protein Lal_00020884 [Lupinus albus]|uniref:Putative transcription factor Hap3/NF-YB family n=1 Tax=Lupinus albus TaxID=3870 RepID=A0A6A5MIC4_LUPAL|nr:putative transcription factor Hap3/NF-YB family [Lupinus albus]KAF1871150.1 hypothetical protein Lal_00020884 [Lupinus albus]